MPSRSYPLFAGALELFERRQPDPAVVADEMRVAGLDAELTYESFPLVFPTERYLQIVRSRYMSSLSAFDDEQLEAGVAEIRAAHPEEEVSFPDRFALFFGRVRAGTERHPVHRGRAPPPRPRLHRDHPGLHSARRQGRRRRDPRRTPQTRARLAGPDAGDREPLHRRDVAAGVHHDGDRLAGCGVERNSQRQRAARPPADSSNCLPGCWSRVGGPRPASSHPRRAHGSIPARPG